MKKSNTKAAKSISETDCYGGFFITHFFCLICSHSAMGCFFMSVCDVELSVYKKIFEREQRPIYGTG